MSILKRFILGTLLTCLVTGCSTTQQAMYTHTTHTIEFLSFEGCPNTPKLRESLNDALTQSNGSFIEVDLNQLNDDDIRRGYGSPTILVDGHDLFDLPTPSSSSMSCRIYAGGLPDTKSLIAKLNENTP